MTTTEHSVGAVRSGEFIFTRDFDFPRDQVFRAWTEPSHLAQWWGPVGFTNPVCDWEVRPGGRIFDVMRSPDGSEHPMGGDFREIVPRERLVFMCGALDERGSFLFELLHTVGFSGDEYATRIALRSLVLRTTIVADKYLAGFKEGMTSTLDRLGMWLAQKTEPFVIERTLEASVERVWQAISRKEDMRQWYFELAEFRPESGFEFGFTVEHEGKRYCHLCRVLEVIPRKRLVHSWRYEGFPGDSQVSFDLMADGGRTRLKLTHLGLESFPPLPDFERKNFAAGWTQIIGTGLKQFVEAEQSKPTPQ